MSTDENGIEYNNGAIAWVQPQWGEGLIPAALGGGAEVLRGHPSTSAIDFVLVILFREHAVCERWASGAPVHGGAWGWRWPLYPWSPGPSLPGQQAWSPGRRQLWHRRQRQGEVSCRAMRPLKASLAMKGRRRSLLCCHHTARRLAADQISLLRERESKWHVIWMLMKIVSCSRLQIPSRKLSSGRHYLPPPPLSLSLVLICISKFTYTVKIIFSQQCLDKWCSVSWIAESVVEELPWAGERFQGNKTVLPLLVCLWTMTTRIPSENT